MGASDCELLRQGWLAQPANAWSSAAYLVAAAYVLTRRVPAGRLPPVTLAGAVALALVALGSAAYHGPQPAWADAAHDASISALLVVVLLHAAGSGVRRLGGVLLIVATGVAVTGMAMAAPGVAPAVHGGLAVAVAAEELARRRRRAGPRTVTDRVALAALGLGAALFVLGRTGGPLCWPMSPFQPHAGWHVATAVAAAATLARRP